MQSPVRVAGHTPRFAQLLRISKYNAADAGSSRTAIAAPLDRARRRARPRQAVHHLGRRRADADLRPVARGHAPDRGASATRRAWRQRSRSRCCPTTRSSISLAYFGVLAYGATDLHRPRRDEPQPARQHPAGAEAAACCCARRAWARRHRRGARRRPACRSARGTTGAATASLRAVEPLRAGRRPGAGRRRTTARSSCSPRAPARARRASC